METNKQVSSSDGTALKDCPLCMESLEIDDLDFFPCSCKYQVCRFCWNRIITSENGLCPACRRPYNSEEPDSFKPVTNIVAKQLKRKQKAKNTLSDDNRKELADKRVVQPNLLFVANLPSNMSIEEEMLKGEEYFGKYGVVVKAVVTHTANPSTSTSANSSTSNTLSTSNIGGFTSAYITYRDKRDAMIALLDLQKVGFHGQRSTKVSLGTTKYCAQFLKGAPCGKRECMYLHQRGDDRASFTKEEMASGKHTQYEQQLLEEFLRDLDTSQLPKGHYLAPKAAPKPLMECDESVLLGTLRPPLETTDSIQEPTSSSNAATILSLNQKGPNNRQLGKSVPLSTNNQTPLAVLPSHSNRKQTPVKNNIPSTITTPNKPPVSLPSSDKAPSTSDLPPISTAVIFPTPKEVEEEPVPSISQNLRQSVPSSDSPQEVISFSGVQANGNGPLSDDENSWLLDIVSDNLSNLNKLALEEQLHTLNGNEDSTATSSCGPPPGFEEFLNSSNPSSCIISYGGNSMFQPQGQIDVSSPAYLPRNPSQTTMPSQQWYATSNSVRPRSSSSNQQPYLTSNSTSRPPHTSTDQSRMYPRDSRVHPTPMSNDLNDMLKAILPSNATLRFGASECGELNLHNLPPHQPQAISTTALFPSPMPGTTSYSTHSPQYPNGTTNYYRSHQSNPVSWNGYSYPSSTSSGIYQHSNKGIAPNPYWNAGTNGVSSMFPSPAQISHTWNGDVYSTAPTSGREAATHHLHSPYHAHTNGLGASAFMNGTTSGYPMNQYETTQSRFQVSGGAADYQHHVQSRSFAATTHGHSSFI